MNRPDLQQFAQQLALWTELVIANGRTPFRRVDLYPKIYTDQGVLRPPLVFWINQQSMMAGGILLLPEQDLSAELSRGRSCCEALGLKHFTTWENDRVRIWQQDRNGISEYRQFNLEDADHPEAFRHLLSEVLEALKLLAVIGLIPSAERSPHYLHNLFQTTLELALPALVNCYRSQRVHELPSSGQDADQQAMETGRLLLLQLLGLSWHEKLPSAILPEKLERAIAISLPNLPEPLRLPLSQAVTATTPPLPLEAAVCFHHLLLRLQQLAWKQPQKRAIDSIQSLIQSWYPKKADEGLFADIYLYPQTTTFPSVPQLVLSDSPALLAATALLADLLGHPVQTLTVGNIFQLDLAEKTGLSFWARLENTNLPSHEERLRYLALFRMSWPNRRFRLTGGKPLWLWEAIHLLGLCKYQKQLCLTLPGDALQRSADTPLWPLLCEHYAILEAQTPDNNSITLKMGPQSALTRPVSACRADGTRTFLPADKPEVYRAQLLLALQLPTPLYRLLENKLSWPGEEELTEKEKIGLQIYIDSRLGQLFHFYLTDNRSPGQKRISPTPANWPRPDTIILRELAQTKESTHAGEQHQDPDQLLAELLQAPEILAIELPDNTGRTAPAIRTTADKNLKEELILQLQAEGVPNYPEQYLYFLENPQMTSYRFTLPLSVKSELLGQVELVDAAGKIISGYGAEFTQALLLSAELGKTSVDLPTDRRQLATLLQHYQQDMRQFRDHLNSLCHRRLKSSKAARNLAKKIWKKLQLPKENLRLD